MAHESEFRAACKHVFDFRPLLFAMLTMVVTPVIDANGNVTTNSYDVDDRLASVTDPLLRLTVYRYDAMSRRISLSNPAIQAAPLLQQTYTPDGLVGSLTDANSHVTNLTPDGFDRLSTMAYPDTSTEVLSYDADGNTLTRKTRAGATISFGYDTLNRLVSKIAPAEPQVAYAYDSASHLTGVSDNSAPIAAPSGTATYTSTFAYDQLNRPLAVNWNPAPTQAPPAASSASFAFGYDATNRRISQSATDNSWLYYPSTATNVSYSVNNLNQYTAVGAVTPSYDGNGNLTGDGTFTYGYDTENRLISASGTSLAASYAYDAQGRRKSKTVNGTTTVFVTDTNNREVLEYDGSSGAINNWYSYALGSNSVLNQMVVASAKRQTLIPDVQGSIIGNLDSSSGALVKSGYLPYGASASTGGNFQYAGQRIDPETNGLYYSRARMYTPAWGRFMQPDPIGYAGGTNLYAYVGNDPLNNIDPLGLWSIDINLIIVGVTVGIGDQSAQRFGAIRFGIVGLGGGYNFSADVPVGASGTYPNGCTYCQVSSVYWETKRGNLGLDIGPYDITAFQYHGSTLVNEYGPSGTIVSSSVTPGSGASWSPDISATSSLRVHADIGFYLEYGASFPWNPPAPPPAPMPPSNDQPPPDNTPPGSPPSPGPPDMTPPPK
jgi:RHS repeat-associated protein